MKVAMQTWAPAAAGTVMHVPPKVTLNFMGKYSCAATDRMQNRRDIQSKVSMKNRWKHMLRLATRRCATLDTVSATDMLMLMSFAVSHRRRCDKAPAASIVIQVCRRTSSTQLSQSEAGNAALEKKKIRTRRRR